MADRRRVSLDPLLDNGTLPAALFTMLARKWALGMAEDEAFAPGYSSRAAVDLDVGALAETGRTLFKFLMSLAGRQLEGLDWPALLTIDGDGVVAVLRLLFCVAASEYEDGPGELLAEKEELPHKVLPTLVKLLLLYFACNTAFWGTSQGEFEVHITAISSVRLRDLDTSPNKDAQEKDSISCIIRSQGVVFVPAAISRIMLDLGEERIDASIAEVACHSFGSLLRSSSRYSDPNLDWLQASFTGRELGGYLEGPIRNRRYTSSQNPVLESFQRGIAVGDLQRALPGHYFTAPTYSPASSPLGSTRSNSSLGICSPPDEDHLWIYVLPCAPERTPAGACSLARRRQKIRGNKNSPNYFNILVNYHYHGENRVINC